eukprot:410603_1
MFWYSIISGNGKVLVWLSKCYEMVMEWLFDDVSVVLCGGYDLVRYGKSYRGLVVIHEGGYEGYVMEVIMKFHTKKDMVDLVNMMQVEVLVWETHMVVMVDIVD